MRPFSPLLLRSGLTRVQCSYWAAGLSLDTQADVEETFLGYLHAGHRPMKRPFKPHPKQRKIVQVLAGYFFGGGKGKTALGVGLWEASNSQSNDHFKGNPYGTVSARSAGEGGGGVT